MKIVPSEVDDQFFKLSEMENYLELMEKEGGQEDDDPIDLMKSMSSEEESEDDEVSFSNFEERLQRMRHI